MDDGASTGEYDMSNIYYCVVKAGQDKNSDRQIVGWNRIEVPEDVEYVQVAGMTDSQWPPLHQDYSPKAISPDGVIVQFTPKEPDIPLSVQAQSALSAARTVVFNQFSSLNEPTPNEWVEYMKTLIAIANGSDVTSKALPQQPASEVVTK